MRYSIITVSSHPRAGGLAKAEQVAKEVLGDIIFDDIDQVEFIEEAGSITAYTNNKLVAEKLHRHKDRVKHHLRRWMRMRQVNGFLTHSIHGQ